MQNAHCLFLLTSLFLLPYCSCSTLISNIHLTSGYQGWHSPRSPSLVTHFSSENSSPFLYLTRSPLLPKSRSASQFPSQLRTNLLAQSFIFFLNLVGPLALRIEVQDHRDWYTELKNESAQNDFKVLPSKPQGTEDRKGIVERKESLPASGPATPDHLTLLNSETHDKLPGQPLHKT